MSVATPPVEGAPRARFIAVCILAALLALVATSRFLTDPKGTEYLARWHGDSQTILASAERATGRDWLRWWTGSWIEEGMPYYRPVASMLMGVEWKLFGRNVVGYCATGWFLHAINTVLLFLLGFRIYRGSVGARMAMGFAAAALFTLPTRGNQGVAAAAVQWWPAQTDMLSLAFALGSLLTLERALERPGPLRLGPALLLAAAALGSKEMAITLPVPAALLAISRRRDWRPVLLGYLAIVAALLWIRFFAVPNAMGPGWKPRHFLSKALLYLAGEPGHLVSAGVYWPSAAAAVAIGAVWGLRRLGTEWPWLIPAPLLAISLTAALFGDSWAVLFVPGAVESVARCAGFFLGAVILLRARWRQPAALLAVSVVAIHLPIIHVGGVHYYYWPAAFWGLVYAVVLAEAARIARDAARTALWAWQPGTATGRRLRERLQETALLGTPAAAEEPEAVASHL